MIMIPKIEYNNPPITIEFEFPPENDFRDQNWNSNSTENRSSNGNTQVTVNYIENVSSLEFTFITEAIKLQLDTFFSTWALHGKSFNYYEDKNNPTFKTVTLTSRTFKPEILFPSNVLGEYYYKFKMGIKNVL